MLDGSMSSLKVAVTGLPTLTSVAFGDGLVEETDGAVFLSPKGRKKPPPPPPPEPHEASRIRLLDTKINFFTNECTVILLFKSSCDLIEFIIH